MQKYVFIYLFRVNFLENWVILRNINNIFLLFGRTHVYIQLR